MKKNSALLLQHAMNTVYSAQLLSICCWRCSKYLTCCSSGQAHNPTRGEKRKGSNCAMALWSGTVGSWTHARTCQVLDGWIDVVVLVAALHPRRCRPTNCKARQLTSACWYICGGHGHFGSDQVVCHCRVQLCTMDPRLHLAGLSQLNLRATGPALASI
jgi:hypothetical protein